METLSTGTARTVHCEDALEWLKNKTPLAGSSLVASLPDISEFSSKSVSQWKDWFVEAASLVLSRTPDEGVTVFYQSDIKVDGEWIDKGFLCHKAAEAAGRSLLWHKIACRSKPGIVTSGRPAYSHILCFSATKQPEMKDAAPDVLPDLGEKTWERGMGLEACIAIAEFITSATSTQTIVNPFCGQGGMLATANAFGLAAVGIERSEKRAEIARSLQLDLKLKSWRER